MKCNFWLAKAFAGPHTPHANFACTISVSDALSCSTPLGRRVSTDVNHATSEFVSSCEASDADADTDADPEIARGGGGDSSGLDTNYPPPPTGRWPGAPLGGHEQRILGSHMPS